MRNRSPVMIWTFIRFNLFASILLACFSSLQATDPSELLSEKLKGMHISEQVFQVPKHRLFTPKGIGFLGGQVVSFNSEDETKLHAYTSGTKDQLIITERHRSLGCSATTSIETEKKRKNEKKSTFVQYDKERVDTKGKDFSVNPKNYRGWVNYQGGHLIDHKYSAQTSHTEERNYIPMHYFYNAPLKEYLVQRCDDYVEIPLYTANPPRIGVKGKETFHDIPIGILFIQLKKGSIENAYYFPNNDYDYKKLKDDLKLKKDMAATIVPLFKLKKDFHDLLKPAFLHDIRRSKELLGKQEKEEKETKELLFNISHGMTLLDADDDDDPLSKISFDVAQKQKVSVDDFLEDYSDDIDQKALQKPFDALGSFLVKYCLGNALKSEFLTATSRLTFLNVIIDFIDYRHSLDRQTMEFIDTMADSFKVALGEMKRMTPQMTMEELKYLARTYTRLASPFIQDFYYDGYALSDIQDFEYYAKDLFKPLKYLGQALHKKPPSSHNELLDTIDIFCDAQETLSNFDEIGFAREFFEKELAFLSKMKPSILKFYKSLDNQSGGISGSYSTSPIHGRMSRSSKGYVLQKIKSLGQWSSDDSGDESEED